MARVTLRVVVTAEVVVRESDDRTLLLVATSTPSGRLLGLQVVEPEAEA